MTATPPPSRSWLRWLILAGVILAGIALGTVVLMGQFPGQPQQAESESPLDTAEEEIPGDEAAEEAARRAEMQARQEQVSEVISDLDRDVLIGDSPTRGNPEADMVVMEFSDFQCPFCARAAVEVDTFMADHEQEVLFVYKHLPLTSIHPEAVPAAQAAWAAQQQGEFWAFHDALFEHQERLGEALYQEIATELGLDLTQFDRDRRSEGSQAAIARDLALAAELGLNSTPTFLLNDLLIPGAVPAEFFTEALARFQAFQDSDQP